MSETLVRRQPQKTSYVKPVALIRGTMVTKNLTAARRFCEELLGLECVRFAPDGLLVRERGHGPGGSREHQPYWVLEFREVPEIETPQEMLNHWGVFVDSQAAVDRAHQTVTENAQKFGLARIQRPRFRNNSYAFYFSDSDSNWWEIEYRTPDLVYTALREKGDQA